MLFDLMTKVHGHIFWISFAELESELTTNAFPAVKRSTSQNGPSTNKSENL